MPAVRHVFRELLLLAGFIAVGSQTLEGCRHEQFSLTAAVSSMVGACGDLVMTGRQLRGRVVVTGARSFDVYRFEVTGGVFPFPHSLTSTPPMEEEMHDQLGNTSS